MSGASTAPGWGHPRQAPYRRWAEVGPYGLGDDEYIVQRRHWLDHLYQVRHHDGTVVFVAEPYNLREEDFADLELLREDGWDVRVDGCGAHHHTTVRIRLERRERPAS